MRIVRFDISGHARYGAIVDDSVVALATTPFAHPHTERLPTLLATGEKYRLEDVRLLAPCEPTKYVGVGLNYRATAQALNLQVPDRPLLFLKPTTGVVGPESHIVLPPAPYKVAFEGELAVVIGRTCKDVDPSRVASHILGYTVTNDLTEVAELMADHGNPTRAKAHDTFAPIGPWIETDLDPSNCGISTRIDGREVQRGNSVDMIFNVAACVSFISRLMTLLPGDVIATGAPPVPSEVEPGNLVEISVEGIGVLRNRVVAAE